MRRFLVARSTTREGGFGRPSFEPATYAVQAPGLRPKGRASVRGGYTGAGILAVGRDAQVTAMTVESNANRRRWAPEWIAVLTLAVAIVALGGSLLASLNAMEARLQGDLQELSEAMRAMEEGLREDMRSSEARVREDMKSSETRVREDMKLMEDRLREDMREVRADLGTVRERVARLEARFDEEFPRRTHSALDLL